ncbi:hypothetical protein NF212_22820 [Parasalinivibrio latis]|uniref:hypothetical protein n=1 Tax=Parasalinivibrio latis TaxID=2952610 RepID=UPI0030E1FA66
MANHPLIERLNREYEYPILNEDNYRTFLESNPVAVLFFTENADRYPETLDVAVVLPELVAAFGNRFSAAVVSRELEDVLSPIYQVRQWPSLVFVKSGKGVGTIARIQDWAVYQEEINRILGTEPDGASVEDALNRIPVSQGE